MKTIEHIKENGLRYFFEILVLIIGILGAFALDNWNDERNLRNKKITQLKNIQNEILLNINTANKVLTNNYSMDIVNNSILSDTLKKSDYLTGKNSNQLRNALLHISMFTIVDDAYLSFIKNSEDYLDDFNRLRSDLNNAYSNQKKVIEITNEELLSIYNDEKSHLTKTYKWYHEMMNKPRQRNNEQINYLLNDPFYKNRVSNMKQMVASIYMYTKSFKHSVIKIYKNINLHTKIDSLPILIKDAYYEPNPDSFANYIGTFAYKQDPRFKIEIIDNDGELYANFNGSNYKVYFDNEVKFYIEGKDNLIEFGYSKDKSIVSYYMISNNFIEYEKVVK